MILQSAESAGRQSVEKNLKVEDFRSTQVFGSYFSATDRAPLPGEYKYMHSGAAALENIVVTFTALSQERPEELNQAVLGVVKSLALVPQQSLGR